MTDDPLDDAGETAALEALYAHREQLVRRLTAADKAILALRGTPPRPAVSRSSRGLWPLLRVMMAELGPGEQFDVPHALKWLEAHGWETGAKDRRQAVATGCSRMLARGECLPTATKGIYEIPRYP
jgi:hypothetical protein